MMKRMRRMRMITVVMYGLALIAVVRPKEKKFLFFFGVPLLTR